MITILLNNKNNSNSNNISSMGENWKEREKYRMLTVVVLR